MCQKVERPKESWLRELRVTMKTLGCMVHRATSACKVACRLPEKNKLHPGTQGYSRQGPGQSQANDSQRAGTLQPGLMQYVNTLSQTLIASLGRAERAVKVQEDHGRSALRCYLPDLSLQDENMKVAASLSLSHKRPVQTRMLIMLSWRIFAITTQQVALLAGPLLAHNTSRDANKACPLDASSNYIAKP